MKAANLMLSCTLIMAGCASFLMSAPRRQQLPLRIALIEPDGAVRQAWRTAPMANEVGGKKEAIPASFLSAVAKGSATFFAESLKGLFESVEILPEGRDVSKYHLVVVPSITGLELSADKSKSTSFEGITAEIEYNLEVSGPHDETVLSVSAEGVGHPRPGASRALAGLLNALLGSAELKQDGKNIPAPQLNLFALDVASALEEAQSNALRSLINTIQSSERIQTLAKLETERRSLPAELLVSVIFEDSQSLLPNGRLDAGEETQLVVMIENQGRGSGYGVVLVASADQLQAALAGQTELGEIPPGAVKSVRLPVKAGLELPDGEAKFLIEVHEKRGYDARKVRLVVPTARLNPPSFSITKPEVIGKPANGEKIELVAHVKNTGPGLAAGATLAITTADPGIELIQSKTTLGMIAQNQSARGAVELAIPRTYSGDSLNLALKVSDGRGDGVASAILPVKLGVKQRKPLLDAKMRLLRSGQEVQELENDQTVDVEITPENNGDLDAEQVSIRLRADHPSVKLQPDQVEVGDLKPKAIASPLPFKLTIPRGLTDERLALSVELSQKDFEARTREFKRPIDVKQPVLKWKQTLRGRRGGSAIEQNETADLEVQIDNTGKLPATRVEAKIDVSIPGVTVQDSSAFSISRIELNERTVVPFKLRVQRSVPPGVLSIPLLISQADFPPIQETLHVEIQPEKEETVRVEKISPPTAPPSLAQRPLIELISPSRGETLRQERVELRATLIDVKGVEYVQVEINGQMVPQEIVRAGRSIRPRVQESDWEVSDLKVPLRLNPGVNSITVRVYNKSRQDSETSLKVTRLEGQAPLQLITSTPVHYSNSWALVIGINAYKKRPLRYAVSDALAVEGALRELGFQNIRLLQDSEATKRQIEEVLYKEFPEKGMGPHDRLFVFFSGHGLIGKTKSGEEGFLLPVDGDPVNLPLTAIPMEEVRRIGDRVEARHVLFVLDTCFSGFALTEDATPHGTTEETTAEKPVVQVLTAGRKGEVVIEKTEDELGLFTRRFLDALRSLTQQGGVLTATELGKWTKTRVMEDSGGKMTPQYGRLYGEGEFQFFWPRR